ncbi:DUF2510 domain-containing protein [Agromyces sp. Root81]|uniref:DUF2510 domain-containing protein n=1 Tax=Agromyces sp. Root81 TaxID=1736601 RepID=UPI001F3DA7E2|nr:DUF2510 domain-containing protein [Agromyces sp. Root81]
MHGSPEPGWYADPEAPDLLRWWDGTGWSDDQFRSKPEESFLVARLRSYRDLSPTAPNNMLATSSLVQALIEVLFTLGIVLVLRLFPSLLDGLTAATAILITVGVVLLLAVWTLITSAASVRNGRRNDGKRLRQAQVAFVIALIVFVLMVAVLLEVFPRWVSAEM